MEWDLSLTSVLGVVSLVLLVFVLLRWCVRLVLGVPHKTMVCVQFDPDQLEKLKVLVRKSQ